jgi:hypothetical protein
MSRMHQVILPKPFVFFWFVFSTTIGMNAQQNIDHWEAVVMDGTFWHYLVPTSQPNAAWNTPEFNDDSWLEGPSGFGYGDGDDATIVSPTPSLYLRHTFPVENIDTWLDVDFFMDYDDGFVAYLNEAMPELQERSSRGTKTSRRITKRFSMQEEFLQSSTLTLLVFWSKERTPCPSNCTMSIRPHPI